MDQSLKNYNFPQFHVKQVSTINALKKLKSKDTGLVTYVGPDDVANLLTCFNELKDKVDPKSEDSMYVQRRFQSGYPL